MAYQCSVSIGAAVSEVSRPLRLPHKRAFMFTSAGAAELRHTFPGGPEEISGDVYQARIDPRPTIELDHVGIGNRIRSAVYGIRRLCGGKSVKPPKGLSSGPLETARNRCR